MGFFITVLAISLADFHIMSLYDKPKVWRTNLSPTCAGINTSGNVGVIQCQICSHDLKMRAFDTRRDISCESKLTEY